ncbi:hypothetical protein Q4566_09360 [Tamlana sp. 2_MG-2023]|uniref:hypothetical protein n=1 Tax=unclassified Tamlana TaxID=2614803 RepID=UPI0026E26250|nr:MULTISPECIES: hypothetical protein [unclassified Tamlana]MDO6760403.1 hypothetical protein [Tamlana sp. 2_MG-2023]MDO6789898.1 hypothetical protein [Tamlana sp. 1_MG-2023]
MKNFKYGVLAIALLVLLAPVALVAQEKTGISSEEVAKANNPLANTKAFNIQNYYVGSIYDDSDLKANTMLLRYSMPLAKGKILLRATMPFSTLPSGYEATGTPKYSSGTGDFNFFATYTLSKPESKTLIGVGPQVVMPTATSTHTGAGKWQAGAALVIFNTASPVVQWGALITYQTSFAGDKDRSDVNLLIAQPFGIFQLGKGAYLRSTALWNFNIETESYNVPLGIGAGHVLKAGGTVMNIYLEPQFTMLHEGYGQPAFQVFGGLNFQF